MAATTIQESRRLLLPLQTVLEAILQFDAQQRGVLSQGSVIQADFVTDGDGAGMDVAVMSPADRIIEWRHFGLTELAAAIINFCRARRIPLPYAGEKSLSVTKEGVEFSIENIVSFRKNPPPAADVSGRPPRYARGYEPHALDPASSRRFSV